jgi:C1A family cysteine protease
MKNTIVLALLFIAQLASAKELIQVAPLNLKLKQVNAGWVAKESTYTHLTQEEAKRFLGLRQEISPDVEFVAPEKMTWSNLPRAFDWRNKEGKNWVSPILNQGNCGSCVAFAAVGVMETQYKISSAVFNFNVKLSPQNLFACGGGSCDWGWMPSAAANYLQRKGVPDEACLPYVSGASGQDVACNASCADTPQRSVRISSFTTPTRSMKDVEAVKAALQKGPVVTTLTVYEDFMLYSSGVYKHVTGSALGGHAISIVGYDDDQRAFIIRNSWGTEWGEQGFGRVSYDDMSGVGSQTWLYDIPAMSGAVSLESPWIIRTTRTKLRLRPFRLSRRPTLYKSC